jgi:phage-related protein
MGEPERNPLFFVGSSQRDLQAMPEDVKDVVGSALLDAQYGETHRMARGRSARVDTPKHVKDRVLARSKDKERAGISVGLVSSF